VNTDPQHWIQGR